MYLGQPGRCTLVTGNAGGTVNVRFSSTPALTTTFSTMCISKVVRGFEAGHLHLFEWNFWTLSGKQFQSWTAEMADVEPASTQ